MLMKVVYADGSWFLGNRKWYFPYRETRGIHHYLVLDGSETFKPLVGVS